MYRHGLLLYTLVSFIFVNTGLALAYQPGTGSPNYQEYQERSLPPPARIESDSYYDPQSGRWKNRRFERDWQESRMGSPEYQAEMRRKGYVWDENRQGWVSLQDLQRQAQREKADKLEDQIDYMSDGLPLEQQERIQRIAKKLRETSSSPEELLERLNRLRKGTFLFISADVYRSQAELAELDKQGAFYDPAATILDPITAFAPGINDTRDIYEVLNRKDIWTGQELLWWEVGLSALGLIVGSGAAYRKFFSKGSKLEKARQAQKAIRDAERAKNIEIVEKAIKDGKVPDDLIKKVPDAEKRMKTFKEVREKAIKRVDNFTKDLERGDPHKIRRAALVIKKDWQAITELNRRSDALKLKFNDQMADIYKRVDDRVRKRVAKQRKIPKEKVEIVSMSNKSTEIKASKDRDYTVRAMGDDIPSHKAAKIYNDELYQEVHRYMPEIKSPKEMGKTLDQTAVHWLDAEAYNRKDVPRILDKLEIKLTDPTQVALTMEHKGVEQFNDARKYQLQKKYSAAEQAMAEGLYQARKQFDNQVKLSSLMAEKAGKNPKISKELLLAVDVVRQIEQSKLSPAEAEALLLKLGYTPRSFAKDVGETLDALERLR